MTQASLRAVTLKTVDNYRQVAEHAVDAYRASGHRMLSLMSRGFDRAAARSGERISPRWAATLRDTSVTVTDVAAKGIDRVSAGTERVIELGSAGVSAQVSRVATLVERIENPTIANGLQTAARIGLPGAQAALSLSEKLVAGADKLSTAIEGSAVSRAKTAAQRAKRTVAARGRDAVKSVRRSVLPAQAEVNKQVKKQVKAVVQGAKTVAAKLPTSKPVAKTSIKTTTKSTAKAAARARRAA